MTDLDKDALMEELRKEASQCDRCPLFETRTQVVFGEGNPKSPLMLIGEGPGETEDETGRPFVGRAGQILTHALNANRMNRKHVWITNVSRCRPIRLENGRRYNRPPSPEEIQECLYWTKRQIEIIQPTVILCLGVYSASILIHSDFKITRERGIWHEDSPYAPHVLAAFHPAYILRKAGKAYEEAYQLLVKDIAAARDGAIRWRNDTDSF